MPAGDRHEFLQSLLPRASCPTAPRCVSLPGADVLPDTTVYAAPGHGDTLRRVRDSGVVAELRARGVEHVLVSNVDNLGASLDPTVLGAHLEAVDAGAELSVEVVAARPRRRRRLRAPRSTAARSSSSRSACPRGHPSTSTRTSTPTRCGSRWRRSSARTR